MFALQHMIRAAAHNDAVPLLRQLQNDLALHIVQNVLGGLALLYLGTALIKALEQPRIRRLFVLIGKQLLPDLRPLCRQRQQLPVIIGKAQRLAQLPSDLPSAAAELSAQRNDMISHRKCPS